MKNRSTVILITACVVLALTASGIMFYQGLPQTSNQGNNRVTLPPTDDNSSSKIENGTSHTDPTPIPPANEVMGENAIMPTNGLITNPNEAKPAVKSSGQETATEKLKGMLTCDQSCQIVGYQAGYCGKSIANEDQSLTECEAGEVAFDPNYYDGLGLTDCLSGDDPLAKEREICCCKEKPANDKDCPVTNRPNKPMDCIEQPGYLKNPTTGKCCWYEASCYGPEGWTRYDTESECTGN